MSEATRGWIYRVALVAIPLLVGYGILDDATAALWVAAAGALLTHGLAAVNTSVSSSPARHADNGEGIVTLIVVCAVVATLVFLLFWFFSGGGK